MPSLRAGCCGNGAAGVLFVGAQPADDVHAYGTASTGLRPLPGETEA
jgi:hypothetical protein